MVFSYITGEHQETGESGNVIHRKLHKRFLFRQAGISKSVNQRSDPRGFQGFSGFFGPDDDEGTLAPAGSGGFDGADFIKA